MRLSLIAVSLALALGSSSCMRLRHRPKVADAAPPDVPMYKSDPGVSALRPQDEHGQAPDAQPDNEAEKGYVEPGYQNRSVVSGKSQPGIAAPQASGGPNAVPGFNEVDSGAAPGQTSNAPGQTNTTPAQGGNPFGTYGKPIGQK